MWGRPLKAYVYWSKANVLMYVCHCYLHTSPFKRRVLTSLKTEFRFNISYQLNKLDQGYLIFNLPIGDINNGGFILSSPAKMQYISSTNVAYPVFIPADNSTANFFTFDDNNLLAQIGPSDPYDLNFNEVPFYRWYLCDYNISGYRYRDLVWVMGKGRPEATNCDKVNVTQVFV